MSFKRGTCICACSTTVHSANTMTIPTAAWRLCISNWRRYAAAGWALGMWRGAAWLPIAVGWYARLLVGRQVPPRRRVTRAAHDCVGLWRGRKEAVTLCYSVHVRPRGGARAQETELLAWGMCLADVNVGGVAGGGIGSYCGQVLLVISSISNRR
jgi:hypothetical protein